MKSLQSIAFCGLIALALCSTADAQYPSQATGPNYSSIPMAGPPPALPQMAPLAAPSYGASGHAPGMVNLGPALNRQPATPFGPQLNFELNWDDGLGYSGNYYRLNALIPWHLVPHQSLMFADLSASANEDGDPIFNFGGGYRTYNELSNRIFGVNGYFDIDSGRFNNDWNRVGVGFESLGKYLDVRANGYFVQGTDSMLLSSTEIDNCTLIGHNIMVTTEERRDNAYTGFDAEVGGPLPFIGRYGMNGYVGGFYLDNDHGEESIGLSLRGELLVTEGVNVNLTHTNDDTFGQNTWVSLGISVPNWRSRRFLKPRTVRERLGDPVRRSNRVHSNIDISRTMAAAINPLDGQAFELAYINPNLSSSIGDGTFENPFGALADFTNNPNIDIIRVDAREDGTGTNLSRAGGLSLFDNQQLLSGSKDHSIFSSPFGSCVIAATNPALAGPIISNSTIAPGGSVITLANNNVISGMTIDAGGLAADGVTVVNGIGISNPLPLVDFNINCNTFQNYTTAALLTDISGNATFDDNTLTGTEGVSTNGLTLETLANSQVELSMQRNNATNNSVAGLSVTAGPGSTVRANNPGAFSATGATVRSTGVMNNISSNNGVGIELNAQTGSTFNAVVDENVASDNTTDGIRMTSDGATFVLPSVAGNTTNANGLNGIFFGYTNGGRFIARTEDINGDNALGLSEDLNSNGVLDAGEDVNNDGILNLAEDTNRNGRLDRGIVSNNSNSNGLTGICIFGDGSGEGLFDIGGPQIGLGNTLLGNTDAGIAVDLTGTAIAQIDGMNNIIRGGSTGPAALTFVLDFIDPGQGTVNDQVLGLPLTAFDVTDYGFAATSTTLVEQAVLAEVRDIFYKIPTADVDARSPLAAGQQLNIDFVIGDVGVAPVNGATEFYSVLIGDANGARGGGVAWGSAVRDANGVGPNDILGTGIIAAPAVVYADSLPSFTSDPNAFIAGTSGYELPDSPITDPNENLQQALTQGNLLNTQRAIGLVTAHEIGHTLSLEHVLNAGSVTATGLTPVMATPALEPANADALVTGVEFAFTGTEADGTTQNSVAQLISALGTRSASATGSVRDGVRITASGNSRLEDSTFINNTIDGTVRDGISIAANGNAQVTDLTIQGNTIQNGGGHGVYLTANGPGALIDASNTIGGSGMNVIDGTSFSQANVIQGNAGDGLRAYATSGGRILGNAINNQIANNGGNGIALLVDPGGAIDFGNLSANRVISGNNIIGNTGIGILLQTNSSPGLTAQLDAIVLGNTISDNAGGGLLAQESGLGDSVLNLAFGGAATTEANVLDGNGGFGVAAIANGTSKMDVTIQNSTISNTTAGINPLFNGDGIYLGRTDSALLLANVFNNTSTANAANGMNVDVRGNNPTDPNQPMTGMANTITFTENTLSANGTNGARFRLFGDSVTIADGFRNTITNNAEDGINVVSTETSSLGNPLDGLPPGRRSVFDGNVITGNGDDGIGLTANDNSRIVLEVTSNLSAGTAGSAHTPAVRPGDTLIANNGSDGIELNTNGGSSDVLITAGTGTTTIDGNGTGLNGGNGILFNASGSSQATMTVQNTLISNSINGASEDTDGSGVLNGTEDLNGNGVIDIANGDGVQFNASGVTTATLQVGGANAGNRIQRNQDDGIAITATGSRATGVSRPIINAVENTIGGFDDGIAAGNGGDGVSINNIGGITTPGISFATEDGPVMTATFLRNQISQNTGRGAEILLTGASGTRNRRNGNATQLDLTRITFEDNTVLSNGLEGIFYQANAGFIQNREVLILNPIGTDINPGNALGAYSPFNPVFTNLNNGSLNGNSDYAVDYLNLRTEQNSFLTALGNTIQNNGTGGVVGEGLVIRVGTNAYVAADIGGERDPVTGVARGNVFGGNLNEDFRTESFLSGGLLTNNFIDRGASAAGPPVVLSFDSIFLDDTAQLDLRFNRNVGNQIAPSALGATYTNVDPAKNFPNSNTSVALNFSARDAFIFQVDDGLGLDNPNNIFTDFGTADVDALFSTGGYNLRSGPDANFPNIGFAPPLP